MRILNSSFLLLTMLLALVTSCNPPHPPKPRGYFRIELPPKTYAVVDTLLPCRFELPQYARILKAENSKENRHPNFVNLEFPRFRAKIYLSYKPVEQNLYQLLEDNRKLAFKHTIKADAIREKLFSNPTNNTHGILFEIKGNAASPLQFFLTDSTRHFLRGSLYFNATPNKDSLAPVIDYLEKDITHLMETLHWQEQ